MRFHHGARFILIYREIMDRILLFWRIEILAGARGGVL